MKSPKSVFLPWRRASLAAAAVLLATAAGAASAADWPSRPIRIVVPSAPGGGTDLMARTLAQKLTEALKVSVIVENKPGGEEMIGAAVVANAPPDGYMILVAAANVAVNPATRSSMPYKAEDLKPISLTTLLPYVILINPKLPVKTVADLVAYSRKQPDGLNLATGGTSNLLASESFRLATGMRAMNIPYKGCAPSIMSVISGETDVTFCSAPAAAQPVSAGRLKALAITGDSRLDVLPGVPTTKELGDPKYQIDLVQWHGVFVPAATPPDIVQRLHDEIDKALSLPDVKERARQLGGVTAHLSLDQVAKFFDKEMAVSKQIVTDANITIGN
ncbi:tripartite tricarboxylate transporter substrate binding protein [Pollutimonas bauzanensis]|uniref:Tripartite-type tricarboxylate transporter, receptor component TctC n=1 Tax=Pollutimonas bauzanensis TaxID=658167 RepID=A0A1M5X754_9BURK|nr:tripartite tricarboxylate transporter substrate binding protein [Pollutimonas bauzanensis]SHH95596.1 Tripartite-type tricarboxylate transporter, receptor component TctC [Pollutimonas bauzanensis]